MHVFMLLGVAGMLNFLLFVCMYACMYQTVCCMRACKLLYVCVLACMYIHMYEVTK